MREQDQGLFSHVNHCSGEIVVPVPTFIRNVYL